MRPLIFLFMASIAFASGPKYDHSDTYIEREFENAYFDIGRVLKGTLGPLTISTMTAQGLTVSSITVLSEQSGLALGKYKQVVSTTSTTAFSTTATTFQNTNLVGTITPSSASSKIKITITAGCSNPTASQNLYLSVKRGATDLGAASSKGFNVTYNGAAGGILATCALTYLDSPNTTSATTYTATIRADVTSGSIVFGYDSSLQVMIMEEVQS